MACHRRSRRPGRLYRARLEVLSRKSPRSPTRYGHGAEYSGFSRQPQLIAPGEGTTVRWKVQGAESIEIGPIGLKSLDPSGEKQLFPRQSTTYKITARSSDGRTVADSYDVTVKAVVPGEPRITKLVAEPPFITRGKSARLSWRVSNAKQIKVMPVEFEIAQSDSWLDVTPDQTTTYTLTATSANGKTDTRPVEIRVEAPPVPTAQTDAEKRKPEPSLQTQPVADHPAKETSKPPEVPVATPPGQIPD